MLTADTTIDKVLQTPFIFVSENKIVVRLPAILPFKYYIIYIFPNY